MKRFYKTVSTDREETGFSVFLDGRSIKTPQRNALIVPTQALADALAGEWDEQGSTVSPQSMGLNKIANTAIDHVTRARDEVVDDAARYAGTDLLCYRSDFPQELQDLQTEQWQPVLNWIEERFGARLQSTVGVIHIEQDPGALAAIRDAIATYDPFTLSAFHMATTITGSVCLALALAENHLSEEQAWHAATVDERFQEMRWGHDPEAAGLLARRAKDLSLAAKFLACLQG